MIEQQINPALDNNAHVSSHINTMLFVVQHICTLQVALSYRLEMVVNRMKNVPNVRHGDYITLHMCRCLHHPPQHVCLIANNVIRKYQRLLNA